MYIINKDTIVLEYDGDNTYVIEKEIDYSFIGNVIKNILNNSCIYYGSTFKGRLEGSKFILKGKYKLPIIISENNNIILFSVVGSRKNEIYWFSYRNIYNYVKEGDFVRVYFKNNTNKLYPLSYTIFNNQVLKCIRIFLYLIERING